MSFQLNNLVQSFIVLAIFSLCLIVLICPETAFSAELDSVFQNMGGTTDSIKKGIMSYVVEFIAFCAFIAWCVGMLLKKIGWDEGLKILFIIILIGFSPTLVHSILNVSN